MHSALQGHEMGYGRFVTPSTTKALLYPCSMSSGCIMAICISLALSKNEFCKLPVLSSGLHCVVTVTTLYLFLASVC